MTKVCVVSPNGYVRVPTPRLWVAQDLTLISKVGGTPSPEIADLRGHRGKLCRWGDRGGGWGAMAAGSAALVGRSLPFLRWLTSISTFDSLEPRLGLLTPGG